MKFKGNLDDYARLPFFIQERLNLHNALFLDPVCFIAVADAGKSVIGQWPTGSKTS
jgi:hypothetical protein